MPASPPEVRGTVGETLTAAGVEVRIDDVTFEPCTGQYGEALPGMTYAVVSASLRNVAHNGEAGYGAFAWVLTDPDGNRYNALIGGMCVPRIEGEPFLSRGITVKPRLAFEIPGTAGELELIFDGTPLPDEGTRIVVSLNG